MNKQSRGMYQEFISEKPNINELLCDELLEEVLSCLSFTSLINCKSVCKSWSRLVFNIICCRGPTVGFICSYSDLNPVAFNQLRLLHPPIKHETTDGVHEYKMETKRRWNLYPGTHLIASCNGLILCRSAGRDEYRFYVKNQILNQYLDEYRYCVGKPILNQCPDRVEYRYYVGNPMLNQWVILPISPRQDYYASIGLAFDGIQGHHYKILQLNNIRGTELTTNRIQCQIFSSETGLWREHQARILNSLTTLNHWIKLRRRGRGRAQKYGFYRNGALYWTFQRDHKYMLVFYLGKEVFQFIELPGDHGSFEGRLSKCLWESKGFLHYTVAGVSNITYHIWKSMNDDDDKQCRWVHLQTIKLGPVMQRLPDPNVLIGICKGSLLLVPFMKLFVSWELNNGSRAVNLGAILAYFSSNGVLDESSAQMVKLDWRYMSGEVGWENIPRGGIFTGALQRVSKFSGTLYPYVFNLADLPIWDGGLEILDLKEEQRMGGISKFQVEGLVPVSPVSLKC